MILRPEIKRFQKRDSLGLAQAWAFSAALALEFEFFKSGSVL
jgi:hypothetical protein